MFSNGCKRSGRSNDSNVDVVTNAFRAAASELPTRTSSAHKPWISTGTLELIETRNYQRLAGESQEERATNALIRKAAKVDRRKWLDQVLEGGR